MTKEIISIVLILILSQFFCSETKKKDNKKQSIKKLKTLGYLTWVPAKNNIQKKGVIKYNKYLTYKGVNIYSPRNLASAYIIDMKGKTLHSWSKKINKKDTWQHIELCKNGDLLVYIKDKMLVRLDWNSNVLWTDKRHYHHEIKISENGDIYSLIRKEKKLDSKYPVRILNDYITILSPNGKIKKNISIYELFKNEIPETRFKRIYKWLKKKKPIKLKQGTPADVFHTNAIEIIKKNINGLFKKGQLLISIRELNLIAVIDININKIIWEWGPGNLIRQHHPTLLENGNILVFDNGNKKRGYSRVIEMNPQSNKIVWQYKGDPKNILYSKTRGAAQRLPNANTLITESNRGHAFEINKKGTIVWDFYSPQINKKKKKRSAIYRMIKIFDTYKYPFLKKLLFK